MVIDLKLEIMGKPFFVVLSLAGIVLTACIRDKQNKKLNPIPIDTVNVVGTKELKDSFFLIRPIGIPKEVYRAIKDSYPTASIRNAYTNRAGQYKLEIVLTDGRSGYLYVDRDGNWIER